MRSKSFKTFLGVLVIAVAILFAFGSCDLLFGPAGNGDTNGDDDEIVYTPGVAIPPLSVIEGTVVVSEMLFEFLDWNWQEPGELDYKPLPAGVEIELVESGDGGTMTITFTGFEPDQDDPNLKIDGVVVLDVTFDSVAEKVTVVKNGSLTVTGHAEFGDISFFNATWIMPDPDDGEGNGDGNDDGPLSIVVSGSIAFGTVEYQMTDILRAVQAAETTSGLVGNTILEYVMGYATWAGPGEWAGPDGVAVEGGEGGPYVITFDEYDPTGQGAFTISGAATVTVSGPLDEFPLTFSFDGVITAVGFVFETIEMNAVHVTWDTVMDGPPDTVTGTMTFDGATYQAKYLTDIIMMFDSGNGGG